MALTHAPAPPITLHRTQPWLLVAGLAMAGLVVAGCPAEVPPPGQVPTTASKAGASGAAGDPSAPAALPKGEGGSAKGAAGHGVSPREALERDGDRPTPGGAAVAKTVAARAAAGDDAPSQGGDEGDDVSETEAPSAAAPGVKAPVAPVAAAPAAAEAEPEAAPGSPEAAVGVAEAGGEGDSGEAAGEDAGGSASEVTAPTPAELPALGPAGKAIAIRMKRTNPLPGIVDSAIGGATEPDSDPEVWVKAMHQIVRELPQVDAVREKARERFQAIIEAGAEGKLPRGAALGKGLVAHELMVAALDGANARVRDAKHLGAPLEGASERGRAFAGMGAALGIAAADAIVAGKGALALTWCRRQARFGALAAAVSRSYEELAAGANAVQEALALVEIVALRFPKAVEAHQPVLAPDALRELRHRVGDFITDLSEQRAFLRDVDHLDDWARLAVDAPSAIWRYESLMALLGVALTRQGSDDASRAVQRLQALAAQTTRPEMAAAAATQLKRVRR